MAVMLSFGAAATGLISCAGLPPARPAAGPVLAASSSEGRAAVPARPATEPAHPAVELQHPTPEPTRPATEPARPAVADLSPRPSAAGELRLTLAPLTLVQTTIAPAPVDLIVRHFGPDGTVLEELRVPGGGDEAVHLSWLAESPGEHRWVVAASDAREPAGALALAAEEQRPAGACDEARLRAERQLLAARWELSRPGEEAPAGARARPTVEAALVDLATVGEREGLLAGQVELARAARRQRAADAAELLERALREARELGDGRAEAAALVEKAQLLTAGPALATLAAALRLYRELHEAHGEAAALYLMGYYYNLNGDPAAALHSFEEALMLQVASHDAADQPWTLCHLGTLHGREGDASRSLAYLALGRQHAEETGDINAQVCGLVTSTQLDLDRGELQAAYNEYNHAYALLAAAGKVAATAEAADGLGLVYLYLGEPDKARQMFAEALSTFEQLGDPVNRVHARLGIGSALEASGKLRDALGYYQQALVIIREESVHSLESLAVYSLGKLHVKLGQPELAIPELTAALGLESAQSSVRKAQIEIELAKAYTRAGRASGAEAAFRRAIQDSGRAPVIEAAARAGLARIERDRGDLSAARSSTVRALAITEQLRSGVIRPDQRVSFVASRRAYYEFYVDLLMRLDRAEPGRGHNAEALAASEQARARSLLDLLVEDRLDLRGLAPEQAQHLREAGDRIVSLQKRLQSDDRPSLPAALAESLERELVRAEEEEKDLDAEIRRRQPGYAGRQSAHPPVVAEVQDLLDSSSALLEFLLGEESSYLFVVTREGLSTHLLPPRDDIARRAASVQLAMARDSRLGGRQFALNARQLYSELIAPAAPELAGKHHLIIAPDGVLSSFSFELLLTTAAPKAAGPWRDLPYLIRDRSISYVPSAAVLARLLQERHPAAEGMAVVKSFVGFGDPEGKVRLQAPLPAAREEVQQIADLFSHGQASVFVGSEASKERVKSPLVTWARYLHFASHNRLDEGHPDLSGLQLAHAADAADDGLLQVREIFGLDLHADLVVLSACSSGLGKEISGEGLIGLTRAFLYAGAARVVVSLWPVDDEPTAHLMVDFYTQLLRYGDNSQALRQAKLDMMASRYSHPHFWAPFVLVGSP
jgi:CHAT domain-containing protein